MKNNFVDPKVMHGSFAYCMIHGAPRKYRY